MGKFINNYAFAIVVPVILLVAASQITVEGDIKIVEARKMPHPTMGMEDCLSCHNDKETGFPPNHYHYTINTCLPCHRP